MSHARWIAAAVVTAALAAAAPAAADPDNLLPWCSGGQTPANSNCKESPQQGFTPDVAPGADPQVPLGVGSGNPI